MRLPGVGTALGLRAAACASADPAEKVWLEVEPAGALKEGDRVEIRCLADGNPPPHFTISKQVRRAPRRGPWAAGLAGGPSAHPPALPQNLGTKEMEEMTPEDNGALVLESAQKGHSGLYQCQGLDLETMASLLSDPQELLVNCEGPGAQDKGARAGGWQEGSRPARADTTAVSPDVSDVRVSPAAPESQEGGSLTLSCEAESNQAVEFQWLREKVPRQARGCGPRGAGSEPLTPSLTPDRPGAGEGLCAPVPRPEARGRGRLPLHGVRAQRPGPEPHAAGPRGRSW